MNCSLYLLWLCYRYYLCTMATRQWTCSTEYKAKNFVLWFEIITWRK